MGTPEARPASSSQPPPVQARSVGREGRVASDEA